MLQKYQTLHWTAFTLLLHFCVLQNAALVTSFQGSLDTGIVLEPVVPISVESADRKQEDMEVIDKKGVAKKPMDTTIRLSTENGNELPSTTMTVLQAILAELKTINSKMPTFSTNSSAFAKLLLKQSHLDAPTITTDTVAKKEKEESVINFQEAESSMDEGGCPRRYRESLLEQLKVLEELYQRKISGVAAGKIRNTTHLLPKLIYNSSLAIEARTLAIRYAENDQDKSRPVASTLSDFRQYGQFARKVPLKTGFKLDLSDLFWSESWGWSGYPLLLVKKKGKSGGEEVVEMTEQQWQSTTAVGFGCEVVKGQSSTSKSSQQKSVDYLWVGALFKFNRKSVNF